MGRFCLPWEMDGPWECWLPRSWAVSERVARLWKGVLWQVPPRLSVYNPGGSRVLSLPHLRQQGIN